MSSRTFMSRVLVLANGTGAIVPGEWLGEWRELGLSAIRGRAADAGWCERLGRRVFISAHTDRGWTCVDSPGAIDADDELVVLSAPGVDADTALHVASAALAGDRRRPTPGEFERILLSFGNAP